MTDPVTPSFGDRLAAAFAVRGRLCVGIDPHAHLLAEWGLDASAAGVREFGLRVVEAVAGRAGIVKPQVAFFERYGAAGYAALEDVIRTAQPDVVILDWEMPLLNGAELVRIVRSPGVFPMPDIPIFMLTAYAHRSRIVETIKLGVNEVLCKPVSAKALFDRLVSILLKPRASVALGDYYGPEPRRLLVEPRARLAGVS